MVRHIPGDVSGDEQIIRGPGPIGGDRRRIAGQGAENGGRQPVNIRGGPAFRIETVLFRRGVAAMSWGLRSVFTIRALAMAKPVSRSGRRCR